MLWLQTALSYWKMNCLRALSPSPELFPVTTRKAGTSMWFWSSEFWCTVKSCLCVHSFTLWSSWSLIFSSIISNAFGNLIFSALYHLTWVPFCGPHSSVGNAILVWNVCRQDREKYICELLGARVTSFTFGAYRCFLPFHVPNTYTFQHCLHLEVVSWQGIVLDVQPGWSCPGHLLSALALWLSPSAHSCWF